MEKFVECIVQSFSRAILLLVLNALIASQLKADLVDVLDEPATSPPSQEGKQKLDFQDPKNRAGKQPRVKQEVQKKASPETTAVMPTLGVREATVKSPEHSESEGGGAEQRLPVVFEGEHLSGARRLGTIELQQQVKVSQGDLHLEADNAQIFFSKDNDEVTKVIASGGVKMRKIDSHSGQPVRAKSEKVRFDAKLQTIELIGKAELNRSDDTIKGHTIRYNLTTGRLKASNVRGVVKPDATSNHGK